MGSALTGLYCRLADRQRFDFHYLRRPISWNQEERPVSSTNLRDDQIESAAGIRQPRCPNCGVAMWLVRTDHHFTGEPIESDRLHFECRACGEAAIIPAL
jgi:predicted RNA-binding Zn-ribbon protein involved in translation (DUF1610 family)